MKGCFSYGWCNSESAFYFHKFAFERTKIEATPPNMKKTLRAIHIQLEEKAEGLVEKKETNPLKGTNVGFKNTKNLI